MNPQQVRQIANRFIDQLHKLEKGGDGEAEAMAALFAEDAELANPIIEYDGGKRAGRGDIIRFWKEYKGSFKDIHSEFTDITAGDQSAGLFWYSSGTASDGRPLQYKGVTHLVLEDSGKIRFFTGYFDSASMRDKRS